MNNLQEKYVLGLDYGTDSVRATLVNALTDEELITSVKNYSRWNEGKYIDAPNNQYRQHPKDYIEGMEFTIKEIISQSSPQTIDNIVALSFDTTGSTPALIDEYGIPLALNEKFAENPNAMFILWKDHTAIKEAEEINNLAKKWEVDYTKYSGGIYSSEWVWSKMLHILRIDKDVREAAYSWVEHCDWIPALVTGNTKPESIKRSRCAAGHKAMWHEDWNGLPSEEIQPKTLLKVIATSTCDIMTVPKEVIQKNIIPGICGQVEGSVIPKDIGLEAGQSAFGGIYSWFKDLLSWPLQFVDDEQLRKRIEEKILINLSKEAEKLPVTHNDLIVTDWLNGRRTPDADQTLKGSVYGLTLATNAPLIFKALVEATAYGSKAIIDRLIENNVEIDQVIAIGGVARKSPFVMQTLSNILNKVIKVSKSDETCALGVSMYAAVVGEVYASVQQAQEKIGSGIEKEYHPEKTKVTIYQENFEKYLTLGSVKLA